MTPEERAADIMLRCWWDEKKQGVHPGFKGLDVEIRNAIRAAVEEEREACAQIAHGYELRAEKGDLPKAGYYQSPPDKNRVAGDVAFSIMSDIRARRGITS